MQEQQIGEEVQECTSSSEETVKEDLRQDGTRLAPDDQKEGSPTITAIAFSEDYSLENSLIESQTESLNEELFDSATSMTFAPDNETLPPSSSANLQKNLLCQTPESDHGIDTLCCDQSSSTSEEQYEAEEEEDDESIYYSKNPTFQQEIEPSVYWNQDFQDFDWLQRTCSPIAEEPEEEEESFRGSSTTTGSSSDLVFETIFSTSQDPEEINDNDLADLKDDPDFVQLLLQNHDQEQQCNDFEETHESSDVEITQRVEEQIFCNRNILMLQEELELSGQCDKRDEMLLILEDLATQLTKTIISEAQNKAVSEEKFSKFVDHADILKAKAFTKQVECCGQDEQCFIKNLASNLAQDIVIQALSEIFVPTGNISANVVHIGNINSSESAPHIDNVVDISGCGICDGLDEQSSIEDFASCLAGDIIRQATSIIIKEGKSFQSDELQTMEPERKTSIEDMACTVEENIMFQAFKVVVHIEKLCTNLVQTCIREALKGFVELRHFPSHPSGINSMECQPIEVPNSSSGLVERHPEMMSTSTQTDSAMPSLSDAKHSPLFHAFNLHSETVSKIPKPLRHKVWKRLRKTKRKYECCKKRHKTPTPRFSGHVPESYVTQASDGHTGLRALVLAHSLRRSKTSRDISILLDNEIPADLRKLLADVYDHVYLTSELYSHDDLALSLLGRPELAVTYTKLHCWRLTQFHKCVFLDADTLVLQNCDELFDREELSAVPDTGWPDVFNSGVFVFRPSLDTYAKLVSLALSKGSFDGGDQGLLNTYFGTWRADIAKRLSFIYNMVSNVSYTYAPAYLHHGSGVKVVHYIGADKPWLVRWRTDSGAVDLDDSQSWDLHVPFLQTWIGIFREKVLPKLSEAARRYVHQSTWMTVEQLLYRMATGDFPEHKERSRTPDETHFPSHVISHPFEEAVHETREAVWESPPPSGSPGVAPPAPSPPSASPFPETSYHAEVPETTPSAYSHHSESRIEAETTPSAYSHHSESRIEAESTPSSYSHHSESRIESETTPSSYSHHSESRIESEPSDPHWEALLWHSVQSPWIPPSPPPPEEYQLPPSQQYHEPSLETPSFRWFSSDSGAQSSWQEPPSIHYPESEEAQSQSQAETPLPPDTECSSETEDLEEDGASTHETDSFTRMRSWEEGNIDYLGKDKFANIWKKLEVMITIPNPKSELENLKESLKDSFSQEAANQAGSVASASLLDSDDAATLVPDDLSEPEDIWPGYPEGDYSGMLEWQEGRIDYCGRDRSDNIMRRLDLIIQGGLAQDGD